MVCDGDIDPEWVEALNSVLDDNRLLTLPSGWRVQFGHNVNFVLETHALRHASPATLTRLAVILLRLVFFLELSRRISALDKCGHSVMLLHLVS